MRIGCFELARRAPAGQRSRVWSLSLGAAAIAVLTACGGGSDEKASDSSAMPATVSNSQGTNARRADATTGGDTAAQAPRRRPRPYDRKGVTSLSVARDGTSVAVASADGKVSVLDATSVRETRVLQPSGGATVAGLIFSGDGRHLVGVSRDSVARIWNIDTGERQFSLQGHEHPLRCVSASADGSLVATGGEETRVMLWDGTTGRLKRILTGATDFINASSTSPDGRFVATGDADARVLVWEVSTGRLLHTLLGHADEVTTVAFSADGRQLASAGPDGKVLLWDVAAGRQLQGLQGQRVAVRSLAFNADGGLLAGATQDGRAVVWNTATFNVAQDVTLSSSALNSVAFDTRNKNRYFVGDEDGRVLASIVPPIAGR